MNAKSLLVPERTLLFKLANELIDSLQPLMLEEFIYIKESFVPSNLVSYCTVHNYADRVWSHQQNAQEFVSDKN